MIYTHVLNRGPAGVRSPLSMNFKVIEEVVILIRIRHHAKTSKEMQLFDL